jgi:hypothetical protein
MCVCIFFLPGSFGEKKLSGIVLACVCFFSPVLGRKTFKVLGRKTMHVSGVKNFSWRILLACYLLIGGVCMCDICGVPSTASICSGCAAVTVKVKAATATDMRSAGKKRYWLDQAAEGVERAIRKCIREGWMQDPDAISAEQAAEQRHERWADARAAGMGQGEALDYANGINL